MSLKNDLAAAESALNDPKTTVYVYQGIRYTLTDLRDYLIPRLKKQVETERTASAQKKSEITQASSILEDALATLTRNQNAFAKGNISEAELNKTKSNVASAQKRLDSLLQVEPLATTAQTTEATGGTFVAPVPKGVTPGQVAPKTESIRGGATAPVTVTKADVDAALASSGLPDTPQNRKDVREQLKAGKKKVTNWEALVAEQAGEYAYLLDPKFEGVPDLLRKAVQQEWFKSEEGKAQFVQELKKTPYGLNTTRNQQGFDVKTPAEKQLSVQAQIDKIRGEYGEIQFDQATLEEVAGVAARNGASDIELGRLVYRAAFKRGSVAPDFTTPVAAKTALGGEDADRIRAIYRAYGQRPDDTQISRILAQETDPASGVVMTEDMLRNNLRDIAKVSYAPFAELLERGISVETIFSPYQQIAARVLEKAPDQVALLDESGLPTQFASALMGEKPMSLTDWITKLKSDDKYGWQFTNEAKQQASNLVMDLEKKFGFRA